MATLNSAYYGGIIYAEYGATVVITNALIQSNEAIEGTIAYLAVNASLTLGPSIQA